MTLFVLAAVLLAALMHALWNALVKAQDDKFSAAALVAIGAGVVAIPFLIYLPPPSPAAWPFIAASAVIHVGYFALVAFAYRTADLGVAYPLTRGSAPPITALFAVLVAGENLGFHQWAAVIVIAAGIIALSADALLRGGLTRATAIAAFTNAGVIVVYTLVDGLGARAAGSGLVYVAWMLAGTALLLLAHMFAIRGAAFTAAIRKGWLFGIGAGGLSLASYATALWAMTLAPIGLVAAVRETSVLFAAALGVVLFGESFGVKRWIALALIVLGLLLLRWSSA